MPAIQYETKSFRKQSKLLIDVANGIITEYRAAGYDLTLRQLYYQFVARDIIPNTERDYQKLSRLISDARLAGLISWDAIVDRTRTARQNSHFDDPGDVLAAAADQYKLDTRADQDVYVETWVEKEALLGVIEPVCRALDVAYLACRGYVSQSAMWKGAQRIIDANEGGQKAVVVYLGDHDPSGLDMTRDIKDRLALFGAEVQVDRIALNMDQVRQYQPPPNPAKVTDRRYDSYVADHGTRQSWELDSLEPRVIAKLIEDAVATYTDEGRRQKLLGLETEHKMKLANIAENWEELGPEIGDQQ